MRTQSEAEIVERVKMLHSLVSYESRASIAVVEIVAESNHPACTGIG